MTTETALADDTIQNLIVDFEIECDCGIETYPVDNIVPFTRAIEQAVLQSEQVQELRKDAERYRWLRDMIENQDLVIAKVGSWSLESLSGDDPDHYIDAVMDRNND